jgi:signal transduction histidine kinase
MNRRLGQRLPRSAWLDAGLIALLLALSLLAIWQLMFPGILATKLSFAYASAADLRLHVFGWLGITVMELAILPLRRRFPVTVLALTFILAVAHSLLLPPDIVSSPADLAVAIAVYTVASTRLRVVAATATLAGAIAALGLEIREAKLGSLVVPALVLAAAWIAGDAARARRTDLGRQAQLAAAAERERITRELHDVTAHALSVMVIQAQGAGAALRRNQPGEVTDALDAIVTTGRGTLAETRRVLGVVRGPEAGTRPELSPQPSLTDLPALADSVRRAGTPVRLKVTGDVHPLPDGVELSAYRIVQEALTNTMKHAGPGASATITLHYTDGALEIEIFDDGRGAADSASPGGHGVPGMRARAAMLGGELRTEAVPGGGFRIRARLAETEAAAS